MGLVLEVKLEFLILIDPPSPLATTIHQIHFFISISKAVSQPCFKVNTEDHEWLSPAICHIFPIKLVEPICKHNVDQIT